MTKTLGSIIVDDGNNTRMYVFAKKSGGRFVISCGDESDIGPDDLTTLRQCREWFRMSYKLPVWGMVEC